MTAKTKKLDITLNKELILNQDMVSVPIQARLNNDITAGSFYEKKQFDPSKSLITNMIVEQSGHGNLLLGESVFGSSYHDIRVSVSSFPSISSCELEYFPLFMSVRILLIWSTIVASTKNDLSVLDPVAKLQGLFIATAFLFTLIVAPMVGKIIFQLIATNTNKLDVQAFLPERNAYVSH